MTRAGRGDHVVDGLAFGRVDVGEAEGRHVQALKCALADVQLKMADGGRLTLRCSRGLGQCRRPAVFFLPCPSAQLRNSDERDAGRTPREDWSLSSQWHPPHSGRDATTAGAALGQNPRLRCQVWVKRSPGEAPDRGEDLNK